MGSFPGTYIPVQQSLSKKTNRIIDDMLTPRLSAFRQITVSDEPLSLDYDRKTWLFTWGNILESAPLRVQRGRERMSPSSYEVDFKMGKLTFLDVGEDGKIHSDEGVFPTVDFDGAPLFEVTASYSFDYFPAEILESVVASALSVVNTAGDTSSPTAYTVDSMPSYWEGVIADMAFAMCMEKLLLDYDLWKGRLIFAIGADSVLEGQGGDIVSQLTTLKTNAEERAYKTINNPWFKTGGRLLAAPTVHYWRSVLSPGSSAGGDVFMGGILRGWRPNRLLR